MPTDIERLRALAATPLCDFIPDPDDAARAASMVVDALLQALRTPSEPAALAGGNAAMQASMSFLPAALCGLAAIQGIVDHIASEA